MFDKFENRYIISADIVTTTAIHIGTAENEFIPLGNRNSFFRNAEGLPLIPGSSLKGLMRSFLEQMLPGSREQKAAEGIFSGSWSCAKSQRCVAEKPDQESKDFKELWEGNSADAENKLADYLFGEDGKLCTVCRLFGSKYNGAKLSIRDAKVKEETFQRDFEIRSGVAIDRDLGKSVPGQLFEVEVVPEGTSFSFQAILENADETEWNCVKSLLAAMELGMLSIGAMKSRGMGGMELQAISFQEIDQKNLMDYLTGKEIPSVKISQGLEGKEED
jgi:CRISPR-associated RAMP protein (TIGR02581 family)